MIDVISPLSSSYQRTKHILFQPFNFEKWVLIAFASFLMQPFNITGSYSGKTTGSYSGNGASLSTSTNIDLHQSLNDLLSFFTPVVIILSLVGVAFLLVIAALFMWLNARGQFMLLDNIVRNRGNIAEPWIAYASQANRLWLFNMVLAVVVWIFVIVIIIPVFLIIFWSQNSPLVTTLSTITLALLVLLYIAWMIIYGLFIIFGAPIMFRTGASPLTAFKMSTGLLLKDPLGIIALALVLFGMGIAIFVVVVLAVICTLCVLGCLIALPYVGSFLLLPITVFYRSYIWEVLAQFGSEYNVWLGSPEIANKTEL